jgi:hypothetical protein
MIKDIIIFYMREIVMRRFMVVLVLVLTAAGSVFGAGRIERLKEFIVSYRGARPSVTVQAAPEPAVDPFEAAYSQLAIAEPSARTKKQPLVLAHYMPWFAAPPSSDQYGFHWHQGGTQFDPYETLPDGRANIASHYYPLTGPYDSADSALLDYQLALMKMAGIDGVIFDWYGITDGLDYRQIHEATRAMVAAVKRAGMRFAICYEDQSITHLIESAVITVADAKKTAQEAFVWLLQEWFADPAYVHYEGRPVVLCFGPQHFQRQDDWKDIFAVNMLSSVVPAPFFVDLDGRTPWADGSYNWPPMGASVNGVLTIPRLVQYLNDFYTKQADKGFLTATVFPGFHDVYAEAGGRSYGFLDDADGATFELTWTAAARAYPDIVQIATWNDYGEGTIIEPTIERGYRELEFLQDARKDWDAEFAFSYTDLRMPVEFFKLLATGAASVEQKALIERAYRAIFADDPTELRRIMRALGVRFDFSPAPLLRQPGTTVTKGATVFEPDGLANLALNRPVMVSGSVYDFTGDKLVDGSSTSYWEGAPGQFPGMVQVDLGSAVPVTAAVLKLNPRQIWGTRTQRIAVQISETGDTFTTLVPEQDFVFDPVANANTVVIQLNATAQYIRLVITGNTGANAGQIAEFEVYGQERLAAGAEEPAPAANDRDTALAPAATGGLTGEWQTFYLNLAEYGLTGADNTIHFKNKSGHPVGIEIQKIFVSQSTSGDNVTFVYDFAGAAHADDANKGAYWGFGAGAVAAGAWSSGVIAAPAPGGETYSTGFGTPAAYETDAKYWGIVARNIYAEVTGDDLTIEIGGGDPFIATVALTFAELFYYGRP